MVEVQDVKLSDIDPQSTVNVRRQGVDENVKKVAASIRTHGYWRDMAIVVRPHPDSESGYDYEHVTGQCRFKACIELDLEIIPAFVIELSDEAAVQRSWLENEAREDLTYSDRAYWTERIFKKYSGEGYTAGEAIEKAAEYLGVTTQTVMRYYTLVALPVELQGMVDQGILSSGAAVAIVRNTYDGAQLEKSQQAMKDRASWYLEADRDQRDAALSAIQELGHSASIEALNNHLEGKVAAATREIMYVIPDELHTRLLAWGRERGLQDEPTIVAHMIATVLGTRHEHRDCNCISVGSRQEAF